MRPLGGYVGFNRVPEASTVNSAASGVWTLREAEALERAGTWPTARDPYFSNVQLLLHGEALEDSSSAARTITASGATISTAQKKFGDSSLLFSSGQYVYLTGDSAFDMSGDFTIEWFQRLNSATAQGWIIGGNANSSGYFMLGINLTGSQQLWLGRAAVGWPVQFSGVSFAANTWQHVAVSRSGSSNRLYLNGSLVGSAITDSTSWVTNPTQIWIGSQEAGTSVSGYIDEFRWTVGTARYTGSTFTVPTSAHPDF